MGAEKTVTVTKFGGGQSKTVAWKEGLDAGTAAIGAGFDSELERCSITVNARSGNRETPLKPGDSVQLAQPVANG
jgi:hypothetical protein